jgi:hypothetical protein
VSETQYAAQCHFHQTPIAQVEDFELIVRRRDQTLSSGSGHSIIQDDMHWSTPAWGASFEVLGLYGVDRRTRQNLPGFGNDERSGQYFFPLHVEPRSYRYWDPFYGGPRVPVFDHSETVSGLPVYVFDFVTYGKGRLWIEPYFRVVVDYASRSHSAHHGGVRPPGGRAHHWARLAGVSQRARCFAVGSQVGSTNAPPT